MTLPTGSLFPTNTDEATLLGHAVSTGDAITPEYANTQSSALLAIEALLGAAPGGAAWKPAVRLSTAAGLPANTYNGTAQTLTATANGALTVDGVAVATDDRILVKNESTQSHNGIYRVSQAGSAGAAYVLTRATDYNVTSSILPASVALAVEGTQAGTLWLLSTPGPITLDTSSLSYTPVLGFDPGNPLLMGSAGGSANHYALSVAGLSAYATGQVVLMTAPFSNTGSADVNINSLGTRAITRFGNTSLQAGDIVSGATLLLAYDGTQFQLVSCAPVVIASRGGTEQTTLAKGDLLAGAGATTLDRLAVGSDGQVLTADSTQTTGLAWKAPTLHVESAGTLVSTRPQLNIIAGSFISLALSDNPSSQRTDVTITNTGAEVTGGRQAFLDGSDGNLTFDGTTTVLGMVPSAATYTLTRNVMAANLTVNSGVTIQTAGFILFVQQTLTNNGIVSANGASASGASGGLAWNATGYLTLKTPVGGGGANGSALTPGSPTNSYGGNGGHGGNGSGTTGATGGTASVTPDANGGLSVPRMYGFWLAGANLAQHPTSVAGGAPGGGGGGDVSHAGGGGGAGGAWLVVCARSIAGSGTFSANGGNSAPGSTGNTGGGGGGGGGIVSLFYETVSNLVTVTASGGTGGAGTGTGTAGTAGSAGNVCLISCS